MLSNRSKNVKTFLIMKLNRVLSAHSKSKSKNSLTKNWGDGFLIEKNLIFRNLRSEVVRLQYQFSGDANSDYLSLPLTQLPWILKEKTIPYFDNVSILEKLERQWPEKVEWDELVDNLKKNYLFHESCHLVARSKTDRILAGFNLASGSEGSHKNKVLLLLLEESFANACELLAIIDVDDQIHRIFFEMNSYIFEWEDRADLKNLSQQVGLENAITFFTMTYLLANLNHKSMTEKDFEQILSIIQLRADDKIKKSLRALSRVSFRLNPRFREVTTGLYLKMSGLPMPVEQWLGFDYLTICQHDPAIHLWLNELANLFKGNADQP